MNRLLSLLVVVTLAGMASGCMGLQSMVRYTSQVRWQKLAPPARLEVVNFDPERNPEPSKLVQSFGAALREDLDQNGPLTVDDLARPWIRVQVQVSFRSNAAWSFLSISALLGLLGVPIESMTATVQAVADVYDPNGQPVVRVEATGTETFFEGFCYGHGERSWANAARQAAESLRSKLAAQGPVIAAALSRPATQAPPVQIAASSVPPPPPVVLPPPPAQESAQNLAMAIIPPVASNVANPSPHATFSNPTSSPLTPPPPPPPTFVSGAPQAHAFALIVGLERYRDVPAVPGARRDAEQFALMARTTLGLPQRNIRMLLDERAAKGDIEAALDWLKASVGPAGRVYFFYSGHGAPDPDSGKAYLVPHGGNPSTIRRTGLLLDEVVKALGETKARESFVFLDSCFSGAGGRSVRPEGARPLTLRTASTGQPRVAIFASAGATEISGPDQQGSQGLFTKYLLAAIGQAKADVDGDGQISMAELLTWVKPRVSAEARRLERAQTPELTVGADLGRAEELIVAHGMSAP